MSSQTIPLQSPPQLPPPQLPPPQPTPQSSIPPSSIPFNQIAATAAQNQSLPLPTSHLFRNELIHKYLPVLKTRPAPIVTKIDYPLHLNKHNAHDETNQPFQHPITSTAFPKTRTKPDVINTTSMFPFNDVAYMYSPYGPDNFDLTDTPFYPTYDRDYHTNPTLTGRLWSSLVISGVNALTKVGIYGNNIYADLNNNLIYNSVQTNQNKSPLSQIDPKVPIITFSNHNSTIDDPFIIVKVHPQLSRKNCRWEICGQDICFLTPFLASGFISGRVLPIQRGSGLYQPHFTRLHNLLSNGEWIHLFPEGKVQFTPNYDGSEHELTEPPSQLLPFKWGVGSLVAEAMLRGQVPKVIPVTHTSARCHSRSNGIPKFFTDASVLVGDDAYDEVKPIVDGYIQHVLAYEQNRITIEPKKEDLFLQITHKLKHIMDGLYSQVENHYEIPHKSHLNVENARGSYFPNVPSSNPVGESSLRKDDVRHHCRRFNCYCQHDEGFSARESIKKQILFRNQFLQRQYHAIKNQIHYREAVEKYNKDMIAYPLQKHRAAINGIELAPPIEPVEPPAPVIIRPWFNNAVRFDEDNTTRETINNDTIGPQLTMDYILAFQKVISMGGNSSNNIKQTDLTDPTPSPTATTQDNSNTQTGVVQNRGLHKPFVYSNPNHQQPFSTHNIPSRLHIITKKYKKQLKRDDEYQYNLSNQIEMFFKPNLQWGTSKYKTALDGYDTYINDVDVDGSTDNDGLQSINSLRNGHQNNAGGSNWYNIWKKRNMAVSDEYFQYIPSTHSLAIEKDQFESTWKEYVNIDYSNIAEKLKYYYLLQPMIAVPSPPTPVEDLSQTPKEDKQLPTPDKNPPTWIPDAAGTRDLIYLTEVFMLRNRMEVYRRTYGFDWNGV
jgi:hypothetical protein